jgi:RNA polymerase sigma-70 factor, ECF subfamily
MSSRFAPSTGVDHKDHALNPFTNVTAVSERSEQAALVPSFAEIFQEHARFLWRALAGLGVRPADVDDALQEVFLVVHRRLREFDGRSLRSWLYAICLRVASDYRRSARVRHEVAVPEVPDSAFAASQHNQLEASLLFGRLKRVLDELDEEQRGAFVLYEIEELTLRETAEALGCPLQTVYSRLRSARAHVEAHFRRAGQGGAP